MDHEAHLVLSLYVMDTMCHWVLLSIMFSCVFRRSVCLLMMLILAGRLVFLLRSFVPSVDSFLVPLSYWIYMLNSHHVRRLVLIGYDHILSSFQHLELCLCPSDEFVVCRLCKGWSTFVCKSSKRRASHRNFVARSKCQFSLYNSVILFLVTLQCRCYSSVNLTLYPCNSL